MSKSFSELVREMNRLEEARQSRPHKHLDSDSIKTLLRIALERRDEVRAAGLKYELDGRDRGKFRQKLPQSLTRPDARARGKS